MTVIAPKHRVTDASLDGHSKRVQAYRTFLHVRSLHKAIRETMAKTETAAITSSDQAHAEIQALVWCLDEVMRSKVHQRDRAGLISWIGTSLHYDRLDEMN